MSTKTVTIIKVSLILAVMVLIAGCTVIPTGNKCDVDSDCGGNYCSDNLQKVVSSTCVGGRCEDVSTECKQSEICVADSSGVRCFPKDPDTNLPIMSCSLNTTTLKVGIDAFNPAIFMCGADCPEDSYCEDSCYCEKKEEILCNENTEESELFGDNLFDQTTNICTNNCPLGFECIDDCICEKFDCPDPVFTNNYFGGAPPIDGGFDDIYAMWLEDPQRGWT